MLEVISNSGPIIHLNEINKLKLLGIFDKVIISPKVSEEIDKEILKRIQNLEIKKIDIENDFLARIESFKIHQAETEVLYLAKKSNKIFLTDDLKAREAAKEIGVEVHGSLGIIALAYKKDLINFDEAKECLTNFYKKSTLFLTEGLLDLTLKRLKR